MSAPPKINFLSGTPQSHGLRDDNKHGDIHAHQTIEIQAALVDDNAVGHEGKRTKDAVEEAAKIVLSERG